MTETSPATPPSANKTASKAAKTLNRPRRRRSGFFNFLLIIGIIVAISLFAWAEQQRRDALGRLQDTEQQLEKIKQSTEKSGQAVAEEVLSKLRKHMDIPTDPQPTVATIIDIAKLREASPFYEKADNGDHLIITDKRAILYDPDRDLVLDVVPVQLQPNEGKPQEAQSTVTPPPPQQQQQQQQPQQPISTTSPSPAA